jgi:outer membrane lipoprotein SlyB
MNANKTILLPLIALTLGLSGCASQPYASQPYPSQPVAQNYPSPVYAPAQAYASFGTVESVRMEPGSPSANNGTGTGGAIVGAVVGGLLGNQVGSGRGRTAATVAGAAGGAMVGAQMGQNMGQNNGQPQGTYLIDVRMDNGSFRTLRQSDITGLQPGSRVRIDNNVAYRY